MNDAARRVPVTVTKVHPRAELPAYSTDGDAGADLVSVVETTLAPGERALLRTGLTIALPPGTVGLVHPRSGLAHRHGVTVANAPGTIDSGYRGEVLVNLVNLAGAHGGEVIPVFGLADTASGRSTQPSTQRWAPK